MTPKTRAEKSAATMWSEDRASMWLGMALEQIDEGSAVLSLVVAKHHCNGMGNCHGGIIFALADSAFAFACNSRNQKTVAQHNSITYIAPATVGDRLIATAQEVSLRGRSGIYDVSVQTEDGTTIAEFRGGSRTVPGRLFEE
ncbi:hydroxyphenylacetyl-CoA thioesterase PaaI [uncultured Litoreibacter sp.]|uniref:hydroxyphenylacetyl-CoA thioesterase PaaI n=1 Tax=uncultured Litoreibacter sp. TaxID=1392394 RepID=UPI00261E18B4|nr:hydroxyphenylacetyl-CoA thioesterase PaaI [uncultured Litoreibacter sp.]